MPVEWSRKSWSPSKGGWPTFDKEGKVVRDDEETKVVGDAGPELVTLPEDTKVTPTTLEVDDES